MIEVINLAKRFGTVSTVAGVSFVAATGKITGLLGKNGAGKTTTLSMICGLLEPDHGSIAVEGMPQRALERRRHLGALLDHQGLYGRLTARENVAYFGQLHGLAGATLASRVETVMEALQLSSVADRAVAGFSQGERVKVALARAIVHSPSHVLLDEPTNGLDIPTVQCLRDLLRRMRNDGACIIFSSHVLGEVRALCDELVVIDRGRTVMAGTIDEVCRRTARATLEEAFLSLTDPTERAS